MTVPFFGRVLDAVDGSPLPGASVFIVERPSVGVSADADGNYTFTHAEPGESIQVSFVGYTDEIFPAPMAVPIAPVVVRLEGETLPEVTASALGPGAALLALLTVAGVLIFAQPAPPRRRRLNARRRR